MDVHQQRYRSGDSNTNVNTQFNAHIMSHIHNWSHNWVIKFNPNKTESVLFTRRNINNPPVYFGDMDNRLPDVNTHCHQGLDLQSDCKWGDYVSKIYKKACDRLKIRRMLKHKLTEMY